MDSFDVTAATLAGHHVEQDSRTGVVVREQYTGRLLAVECARCRVVRPYADYRIRRYVTPGETLCSTCNPTFDR